MQKLRVPDQSKLPASITETQSRTAQTTAGGSSKLAPSLRIPASLSPNVKSEPSTPLAIEDLEDRTQRIEEERFVKMEAKRITHESVRISSVVIAFSENLA